MEYVMLKDVCTINMGQSPDSDSYNDNGEGVPFFQGNADFGERYPVTRKWCSAPTKMAVPEDILISVRAPIGAMNYAKEECCIGRGLAALTPDKTKVSPEFIFWLLKGKNAELNSKGTGSTFKAIGRKVLEETKVPDIPLEKQLERSETLEKIYAVIQHRKSELQMLDDLIKARFVEMFGDPVAHLDKGETVKLDTIADKITVGFVGEASNEYVDEGVPYLRTQNVRVNRIDLNGLIYVNESFHNKNQKTIIHPGDVIISRVGVNRGMAAMVPDSLPEANIANCLIVGQTDNINSYYLAFYMNMSFGKRPQFGASVGSAQGVVNTSILKKWEVYVPDRKLQDDFFEFSNQVDKSKVVKQKVRIRTINISSTNAVIRI